MFNGDRRGTIVNVAQTIRHERYTNDELPYDIALVKLEKPLELSSKINTVCLPKQINEFQLVQDAISLVR